MPIYKGNKEITAIYKGDTPISAIYKGDTLIFSSGTWEQYLYEFIYNSLVPTTINNKQVKNKARIKTIYANGVIENQLVNTTDTSITLGTHKYLTKINGTWSIITGTSQTLSVSGGTDMIIDLTQRYPFNTPTTLTDIRVQALLNRGYISYNTGTYKGTDISEISSEPYNLFDEVLEVGSISLSNGQNTQVSGVIRSKNYVSVMPNNTYVFERQVASNSYVLFYDSNYNFLSRTGTLASTSDNFTTPNGAFYVRFIITSKEEDISMEVCLHLQGTRTGYAPHKTFTPIALKYQGNGALNSHDTLEITSTEYVFTKDNVNVNLNDLGTWTYDSSHTRFYSVELSSKYKTPTNNNTIANLMSSSYQTLIQQILFDGTQDKTISYSSGGKISLRDTSLNGDTSLISGNIQIQLATPQVIRIPKKHLGVVDLGSLNWTYQSDNQIFLSNDLSSLMKKITDNGELGNLYCSKYQTHTYNGSTGINNIIIQYVSSNINRIFIRDTNYTDANTFKTAMSGIYLFYETQDEVADMPFAIAVESGGTITTDSEVLPNILMGVKSR